jgi:Na+-translocating ferredoxin:NAD+ oxidoreductase subunit C
VPVTEALEIKSFAHGVHPPEHKDTTKGLAIRQFPFAPVMVILLSQHLGAPAKPTVREGQEVTRGQRIGEPDGFMSVAMHAPASGVVERIGIAPNSIGKMVPAVFLRPFPASGQEVMEGIACDVDNALREEIITAIQQAGVVGLGGAAFPTHVKLSVKEPRHADTLLINGVECEPYLTTDHRVMLEQVADIFMGVRYTLKASRADSAIIAVEANKPDAIEALRAAVPADLPVQVRVVKVKFPQGAEKILIKALLDREVPSGGLPIDVGVVSQNVATTAEIGRLLPHGRGIMERVITISGPGVERPGNYLIPIGTPLRFALDHVGLRPDATRVFLGGPMMGQAASSLDIPVTKGTSGVVVFTENEIVGSGEKQYPCIRCGHCLDACPMFLNPSRLGLLARNREYDAMAQQHSLMDCFECGCCSFVCPSHIPLVQYFRVSKSILRERQAKS